MRLTLIGLFCVAVASASAEPKKANHREVSNSCGTWVFNLNAVTLVEEVTWKVTWWDNKNRKWYDEKDWPDKKERELAVTNEVLHIVTNGITVHLDFAKERVTCTIPISIAEFTAQTGIQDVKSLVEK